jgi:AcrR family transcriptional regulator
MIFQVTGRQPDEATRHPDDTVRRRGLPIRCGGRQRRANLQRYSSVRVKTDEKRQEIMAVARHVFLEKGYAASSMAEISARLGGSKGTLYNYFSSKEELFAAVMLEMANRNAGSLMNELERASDMRDEIETFMHRFMRVLCSPEVLAFRRMLIGEAGRSAIGKLVFEQGPKRYLQKVADLFARQVREGRFREVDPWRAALHIQSLCMGGLTQWVLEGAIDSPPDEELAAAAHAAAEVFLRAYSTADADAPARKPRAAVKRKRG